MKTKNLILLILAAVMMFIGIVTQAQPNTMTISESQRLRQEKTALVEWIVAHTKARKKPISAVQARRLWSQSTNTQLNIKLIHYWFWP